tara:strand:- start:1542 stop:1799 length:258 start_codon:yes stop_codon:yes gene_type:complete
MELNLQVLDATMHTKKNDGPTNGEVVKRCTLMDIPGGKSFVKTFFNFDAEPDMKVAPGDKVKVHCDAINPFQGTMYLKGALEVSK